MKPLDYDVVIVGSGLVGASLAFALAQTDFRIAIIDTIAEQVSPLAAIPHQDARSCALSYGSRLIFEQWGLWSSLQPFSTPIQHIHVSDRRHFGFTRINAVSEKVPALGYVIEIAVLQRILNEALAKQTQITRIAPARVQAIQAIEQGQSVTLQTSSEIKNISAACLLAVDGTNSPTRKLLHVPTRVKHYAQSAIIANICLKRGHGGIAYERLTEQGPLALLPLGERSCALVWTLETAQAAKLAECHAPDFLRQLQRHFGYRLGRFTAVGRRDIYPLMNLSTDQSAVQAGCFLLGNAAHTVHPVAGQGFNVGLRDVECFARLSQQTRKKGALLSGAELAECYYAERLPDQQRVLKLTDNLVHLFSLQSRPAVISRNLALIAADLCPAIKRRIARQGMGLQLV